MQKLSHLKTFFSTFHRFCPLGQMLIMLLYVIQANISLSNVQQDRNEDYPCRDHL